MNFTPKTLKTTDNCDVTAHAPNLEHSKHEHWYHVDFLEWKNSSMCIFTYFYTYCSDKTITYNHLQMPPQMPSGNSAKVIAIDPKSHRKRNRSAEIDLKIFGNEY